MKFKFLILLLSVVVVQKSAALEQAPLSMFEQNFSPSVESCGETWQREGATNASCQVSLKTSVPTVDLLTNSILHHWTYDSTNGWKLDLWLFKSLNGYRISVTAKGAIPNEILNYNVAQKYVRSLLEDWGQVQFKQLVMRPNSQPITPSEKYLGQLNLVSRSVDIGSEDLFNACQSALRGTKINKSCVVHFASYKKGEIVLSQNNWQAKVIANDTKANLEVAFMANQAWLGLGPFSLSLMRIDFTGDYSPETFKTLYFAAIKKLGIKTFNFQVQKLDASANNSLLYNETLVGPLLMRQDQWAYSAEACKQNWNVKPSLGFCLVKIFQNKIILGEDKKILEFSISGPDGTVRVMIQKSFEGYKVETFGSDKIVSNFEKVNNYILKAIALTKKEDFQNLTLILPE